MMVMMKMMTMMITALLLILDLTYILPCFSVKAEGQFTL